MEYCGFTISVTKQQIFYEVPLRAQGNHNNDFSLPIKKSGKQAFTTSVRLDVYIEGYKVIDQAFLFELRAILEEFMNKRLGERKPGRAINAVIEPFGAENGCAHIERHNSQLVIKRVTDEETTQLVVLDVVNAKTLHAILHKALQNADFQ